MSQKVFNNVDSVLRIKKTGGYGVTAAIGEGNSIDTYCSGSGRFGQDYPVNPDMLFQAGSVSKPVFALTLLRYVDKGIIDLDADISEVVSDFAGSPMTFSALLSHTAGFNVHGFEGYRADHRLLSLEDVLAGKGNSPAVKQTLPYGGKYSYSGGGITLAELAFTRITGTTLQDAYLKEVAEPLGLKLSGYFQPLDEEKVMNASFGGKLGIKEDRAHGYHYYPEHAAAGFWTTPSELVKIGMEISRSYRNGGLLKKETAERMATAVKSGYGLCLTCGDGYAGHGGANEGFLTFWRFSLTDDYCVSAMINRCDIFAYYRLEKVGKKLFENGRKK